MTTAYVAIERSCKIETVISKFAHPLTLASRVVLAFCFASHVARQGELFFITRDYNIFHMPCGDLCAETCLDQAEELPLFEVIKSTRVRSGCVC